MSSDAPRSTWYALFAPPVAWFVALNAAYFLVDWACGSGAGHVLLHAVLLGALAVSASAVPVGIRVWRRSGKGRPGESADPQARTRLLALVGFFGGMLFSVAILWFWVAGLILSPCEPGPRGPFAPSASVQLSPGAEEMT